MRVAIINLTRGGMSGGYRKYLRNVLPRMANHPKVDEILCVGHRSLGLADWFEEKPNLHFANCDSFRLLRSSFDTGLRKHLERFSPDILFIPTERFLKFREVPVVNMVQNMEPLAYTDKNNPVSEKIKNFVRRKVSLATFESSQRIIATSQFVKQFLISDFAIPETKIGVVYHGASDIGTVQSRPQIIPEECKGRFLFTAGSIRPARGLEDIINAVALLAKKQIDIKLVIAGYTALNMLRYRNRLESHIAINCISDRVIWTGNLRSQEMDWCYKNCHAFIMTSRVESFGIIATEAMAGGCICISADNPCLPELFGDASIYYPPKDGKLLADVIKTVLAWEDNQRKIMSEKAKKRAAEFSWDVCAKKTVAESIKTIDK